MGKFIFEDIHLLLFHEAILAKVFEGFMLFFLCLGLADALLALKQLGKFFQFVIMEQLVLVDGLERMTKFLCILGRSDLLSVCLYLHAVAEFTCAVHEVEFFLCVIELAFHLAETLKVLVVVGDIEYLGAFDAKDLLVDGLQYLYLQAVDDILRKPILLVCLIP